MDFSTQFEALEKRTAEGLSAVKSAAGDQTLIAGTINPVSPKRVISSASIPAWLDKPTG